MYDHARCVDAHDARGGYPAPMTPHVVDFYIIQHGQKVRVAGDPPLTGTGEAQARRTGAYLRDRAVVAVWSSPLLRASETARLVAEPLGLGVYLDERLRERMNWGDGPAGQTLEQFLEEWTRATEDRDYTPTSGASSRAAGRRFESVLVELSSRYPGQAVAIIAHGGVTIDLLRNVFSDRRLRELDPELIEAGMPSCAITHLARDPDGYALRALASVGHLADGEAVVHRP